MSWTEELADRLLTATHAVHDRTEELRQTLRSRIAELHAQLAPPPTDEDALRTGTLRAEMTRIDALLAEARGEADRLSAGIIADCRRLSGRLLPAARTRLILRSRTALHERVQRALDGFQPDLLRLSIRVDTTAQQEAALGTLAEIAGHRREQLAEAFAAAGGRAAELQARESRARQIQEGAAKLNEREHELLTKLSQHAPRGAAASSLAEGILTADERSAASLRKHLFLPMLSDLQVERAQDLYDVDPLERLEQSMRGDA